MLIQKSKVCKVASVGFLSLALASSVVVGNTYAEGDSESYSDVVGKKCVTQAINAQFMTDYDDYDDALAYLGEDDQRVLETISCDGNNFEGDDAIKDFSVVSLFPDLLTLELPNNEITSLDLSKNEKLATLNVSNNNITSLDLSKNEDLFELNASYNKLTSLNLSSNGFLNSFNASNNELASITLPRDNGLLEYIDVSHNKLTTLDVSNSGESLKTLIAFDNKLSSINVARNPLLEDLLIDNILVYTGIVPPTETEGGYVFNLSSLRYMLKTYHLMPDGKNPEVIEPTIKDTDYYTYDEDDMVLTVKDKKKTGEFVQVVGLNEDEKEEEYFSYKLKLFDAEEEEEEEEDMKVPNTGGNTKGSEFITAILVGLPVMGAIILGTLLAKGYQRASRKVDFK